MVPKASVVNISDNECNDLSSSKTQVDKKYLNYKGKDYYESTSLVDLPNVGLKQYPGKSLAEKENGDHLYLQIHAQNESQSLHLNKASLDIDDSNLSENDETLLLPHNSNRHVQRDKTSRDNKSNKKTESAKEICLQTMFPLLMAGLGMVAVGIVLDKVQVFLT